MKFLTFFLIASQATSNFEDFIQGAYMGKQDPYLPHAVKIPTNSQAAIDEIQMLFENNRASTTLGAFDEKMDEKQIDSMFEDTLNNGCLMEDQKKKSACQKNLEYFGYDAIGKIGNKSNDLHDYLKKHVFQPLALDVQEQTTMSEIIQKIVSGSLDKSSLFQNQPLMTNFQSFKEAIRSQFDDVMGKSSDPDAYQEAISQLMISILKKCHIYWNSMRYKGEMHQSLQDTLNLMKYLM